MDLLSSMKDLSAQSANSKLCIATNVCHFFLCQVHIWLDKYALTVDFALLTCIRKLLSLQPSFINNSGKILRLAFYVFLMILIQIK